MITVPSMVSTLGAYGNWLYVYRFAFWEVTNFATNRKSLAKFKFVLLNLERRSSEMPKNT